MKFRVGLCLFILVLNACSITGSGTAMDRGEVPLLVWPEPPQLSRIKLVNLINKPEDIGIEKSLFSKFLDWFAGAEERRMSRPYAVAINSEKMVVADPDAAAIHIFNMRQKQYEKLLNLGETQLAAPIAVALGSERLFIADSALNKVFILDQNLEVVKMLKNFKRPTSLVFDDKRNILYVADTLAHKIKLFSSNGDFKSQFGGRGEGNAAFNFPSHIAFADDHLFVNDTLNFRIQIFKHDGTHVKTFGKHGDVTGAIGQSKGVAVDSDGHLYVADAVSNRIQIFNQDGDFLLDFGRFGQSPGFFRLPAGMAVLNDLIYVADSYNSRIQVFQYLKGEH